ncbi:MAG: hypothetical protein IAG10_08480 [Planctomycetaceae bacterium]|nr:hypothetical protein [Planctomycetaceae bacterium]
MRRIHSWPLLLLVFIVILGFLRGWFTLSGSREAVGRKVDVHLTVDPDKVNQDAETVKDKAKELTGKTRRDGEDVGNQPSDTATPKRD